MRLNPDAMMPMSNDVGQLRTRINDLHRKVAIAVNGISERDSVSVKDFGADDTGVSDSTPAFQLAIANIAPGKHCNYRVPAGTYLLNSSPVISGKTVAWILDHDVTFTGVGTLPGTVISMAGPEPSATALGALYVDFSNPDNAGPYQIKQHIPSSVDMNGGGAVQGCGLVFNGDTSAQTPNSGFAETNGIRMTYTVNPAAGPKLQVHLINGLLIVANDEGGSGNEDAVVIATARATGPTSGTAAVGIWGADLHVEKTAGVLDGKMVGLEVGVHKAPALGAARCRGIDVWSADRSGITASRAGDALYIHGSAGWTNFLKILHTDESTAVMQLDQNGNLTVRSPTGNQATILTTNAANTTTTLQISGQTAGAAQVNGTFQAAAGGQLTFGATTNHHLVVVQNNIEVIRFINGFLYSSPSGVESTGAGSAALSNNCPAVTPSAPYKWIKARTSDGSTVYFPVWK